MYTRVKSECRSKHIRLRPKFRKPLIYMVYIHFLYPQIMCKHGRNPAHYVKDFTYTRVLSSGYVFTQVKYIVKCRIISSKFRKSPVAICILLYNLVQRVHPGKTYK